MDTDALTRVAEIRIDYRKAILLSMAAAVVCVGGLVFLLRVMPNRTDGPGYFAFLAVLLAGVILHELVHALALLAVARVHLRDVRFGFNRRAMMPYCHCRVPVGIRAYRATVMAPLFLTAVVGAAALLVHPSDLVAILAGVMLAACLGDLLVYRALIPFGADSLVVDHPSEVGCDVFVRNDGSRPREPAGSGSSPRSPPGRG